MSGRNETKVEFLSVVAKQYPTRIGVLTQKVGSLKFAEINFDPKDEAVDTIMTKGIKLPEGTVILPCLALDIHMEVIRLRLSNLPFLGEQALLEGLQKSLGRYGEILDVGMLLEATTGTYMCTGYAVLNIVSIDKQYQKFTHLIPWNEAKEQGFYAVWNQMPTYCRYCHEEGHPVLD
jgi:hypothetical protein